MKRSDVVLNLATELILKALDGRIPINALNFDDAQDLAEFMLSHVEKAGMLPPRRSYVNPRDSVQIVICNEWEPEDETK